MDVIVDFDDFNNDNADDCLECLNELKAKYPNFKVTLFAIPKDCSDDLLSKVKDIDWIELALHGTTHTHFSGVDYKGAAEIGKQFDRGGFVKGFKGPYWSVSKDVHQWLKDNDYWIGIESPFRQGRTPIIDGQKYYALWDQPETDKFDKFHGHVTAPIGPIRRYMDDLLKRWSTHDNFLFVSQNTSMWHVDDKEAPKIAAPKPKKQEVLETEYNFFKPLTFEMESHVKETPYPPGTEWNNMTIRKEDWLVLNQFCAFCKPQRILEYGPGTSTKLFTKWADVHSIEENQKYKDQYTSLKTLVDKPEGHYDFAFIDGPPGKSHLSRENSVIQAKEHTDAIIMHDIERGGELETVAKHLSDWKRFDFEGTIRMALFERPSELEAAFSSTYFVSIENWEKGKPFLTIATRTCLRPKTRNENIESVKAQTDRDYQHMFIVDRVGKGMWCANKGFYENKDRVKGRYVFILDDDRVIIDKDFVSRIKEATKSNPDILMIRSKQGGKIYPAQDNWGKEKIHFGCVDAANYVVRADIWDKYIGNFARERGGDYSFINHLFGRDLKIVWLDTPPLTVAGGRNHGLREGSKPLIEFDKAVKENSVPVIKHEATEVAPKNPKIAIITRAINRLEYTTKCVSAVQKYAGYDNYEHIVVTQGSTDGTVQWLDWLKRMPNKWFDKVKPIHTDRNFGDWGGLIEGMKHTDAEYIIQLDNDIEILHQDWLKILVHLYTNVECIAMMIKRDGVKGKQGGKLYKEEMFDGIKYKLAQISRPVACYITKREYIEDHPKYQRCDDLRDIGLILKITDIIGTQLEGYSLDGEASYIQHVKYDCARMK